MASALKVTELLLIMSQRNRFVNIALAKPPSFPHTSSYMGGDFHKLTNRPYTVPPDIKRPQSAVDAERAEGLKRERYQSQVVERYRRYAPKRRLPGEGGPEHERHTEGEADGEQSLPL